MAAAMRKGRVGFDCPALRPAHATRGLSHTRVATVLVVAVIAAHCCAQADGAVLPPCGIYEGVPHDASINGQCTLPDGEILTSAVWAGRNPGTPVNYNVNWTYGGDGSKPGGGYAAIHGCENDNVTFFIEGTGSHQLVLIKTQAQAPCGFANAEVASEVVQAPTTVVVNFTGRAGFFNYADMQGDNCDKGMMHIQIIFHSFPTAKYGCFAPGKEAPPGLPTYLPAPPALDEFTSGAPVASVSLPGPSAVPAPAPLAAVSPSPSQTTAAAPAPVTGAGTMSPSPAAAAAPQVAVNEIAAPSPAAAAATAAAPAPSPSSAAGRRAAASPALLAVALLGLACAVASALA